jgi:hypothetical protein
MKAKFMTYVYSSRTYLPVNVVLQAIDAATFRGWLAQF